MAMDETTQQNAALVEETTSAAQSMKEQAKELTRQMAVFKVSAAGAALAGIQSKPKGQPVPSLSQRAHVPGQGAKKAAGQSRTPVAVGGGQSTSLPSGGDDFEEF
jgi:methyl-accepting chemotaxis protein